MGRKFGFSFSWRRALGISSAKARISRKIGIPLTRSGRQRKMGRAAGCLVPLLALPAALLLASWLRAAESRECDLLVYGGTPAGIGAAVAAADEGRSVLLVEPHSFVGGLVSNGLTHTDFRSLESLTGVWHEFNRRVVAHYAGIHGPDSEQVAASYFGNFAEPKVNRLVFEEMLADRGVEVVTRHLLDGVAGTRSIPSTILSARFVPSDGGAPLDVRARVYVDASYEGDLMARAGVRHVVGREDEAAYGEPVARAVPPGGDGRVQGYNFRWCVTNAPDRLPAPQPEGYDRTEFLPLLDLYADGRLTHVFGVQGSAGLELPDGLVAVTTRAPFKLQPPLLPNGKADINDMSRGVVRLSMPDINDAYPEADEEERRRIVAEHERYQVGMLHFLQHDEAVPEAVRQDALSWGFCGDEWPDHGHLPEQIYVREARRMVGRHVFTQNDTRLGPDDVRIPLVSESIAIGDYSHNCHGTGREGTRFEGRHTGEFYERNAPYQIAYGTLVPNEVWNLLVPVAASASHVGFGALRLEPVWTAMGHAAGLAAHLALAMERPEVQAVDVAALQALLHRQGAATLYVSDVPPGHSDFEAVQWMGTLGGWHGLARPEGGSHPDWTTRFGQYAEPYPGHAAELDRPADEALLARWREVLPAERHAMLDPATALGKTRGELLRELRGAE